MAISMTDGRTFMNTYHSYGNGTGHTSESEYAETIKNFDEHIRYSKDDRATEDVIGGVYRRENAKINTSQDYYDDMIGDDILSNAEDMLNNRFNRFSRYGYLDPSGELITGAREYLFFSKPDLNLVNKYNISSINKPLANSPFFNEAFRNYKLSYFSLQQTFGVSYDNSTGTASIDGLPINLRTKYIPLLSNMVTSTLDLPDISATDVTNNQNLYQTNTSYREGSLPSDLQYDFSLEFKDTKYLDVYMLFKIYDEYIRYKYMAEILPTRMEYIFNKIYPEPLSIWKIIVDDTGRIMYWAKATGCTPMSVPRSTISNIEGNIKFTVNWKAQFIRDMDPINLAELNYLTSCSLGVYAAGNDVNNIINNTMVITDVMHASDNDNNIAVGNGPTWVGYPYVMSYHDHNPVRTGHHTMKSDNRFHKLVWVNPK